MRPFLYLSLLLCFSLKSFAALEPKILYEEDPSLLTTSITVVVQTGATEDPRGKGGLTNLLAELMLRGTKKRNRTKFQSEVERMGATIGAGASHDHIFFEGKVIAENTNAFLALLEDCLLHPAFTAAEFNSLKQEDLAEISNKKNQNNRLSGLAVRKVLFANTPLEHPTDGSLTSLAAITLDDIQKAYNDRFHQGNVLFAIAGPLKEADVSKKLKGIWQQLPDGLRVNQRSIPLQVPSTPTLVVVQKPATSTGAMMFGQRGITASDPTRYALGVGNYAFGGEIQLSRLFRVIRGELGWTYAIGSTYNAMGDLSNQEGLYVISTTPSMEFTAKTLLKSLAMWQEYYKSGLKKEELLAARESLINSYPFEFESAEKRIGRRLHSYLYNVPILSPEDYAKTLNAIDNDGIVKAIQQKQSPEGWLISVVADAKTLTAQLEAEQKEVPADQRIKISKVFTPDEIIQ